MNRKTEEQRLRHNEINRESYARNKESKREYYLKNKEKIDNYHKGYHKNNPEKFKYKSDTDWSKRNPELNRAKRAKRRASQLQQTPKWVNLEAIKEFYKNCPKGYEVDHIIPLQGDNVRGLHILENLQYLLKSENRRKNNKYVGL